MQHSLWHWVLHCYTPWLNGLCPKLVASYDPKHYSSKETDSVHFNASSYTSAGASEPFVISCCQLTKSLTLLGRLKETRYGTLILFSQSETEILVLRDNKCIVKEVYVLCVNFFEFEKADKSWRKNRNYVIIYCPSHHSKPVWLLFFCRT